MDGVLNVHGEPVLVSPCDLNPSEPPLFEVINPRRVYELLFGELINW